MVLQILVKKKKKKKHTKLVKMVSTGLWCTRLWHLWFARPPKTLQLQQPGGVFTGRETTAHNLLHQLSRWLFVITNQPPEKHKVTPRPTRPDDHWTYSLEIIMFQLCQQRFSWPWLNPGQEEWPGTCSHLSSPDIRLWVPSQSGCTSRGWTDCYWLLY